VVVKYNIGAIDFNTDPGTFIAVLVGIGLMIFGIAYAIVVSKKPIRIGKAKKSGKKPKKPKAPPVEDDEPMVEEAPVEETIVPEQVDVQEQSPSMEEEVILEPNE
ncbi:MAG: hypothetical protein KAJ64_04965, partial [Thermoplasmata archaeon]|nr:hypothetical protein [Thermoplasmata archaeon]